MEYMVTWYDSNVEPSSFQRLYFYGPESEADARACYAAVKKSDTAKRVRIWGDVSED